MSSAAPAWTCCAHRSRTPKTAVANAPPLLLRAAKRLEPLDVGLARATYLEALAAAQFAGRFAVDGNVVEVAHAALASILGRRLVGAWGLGVGLWRGSRIRVLVDLLELARWSERVVYVLLVLVRRWRCP